MQIRKGIESPGNAPVIMEEVANHLRKKLEAKEAMLEVAEDKRQLAISQICSKARTLLRLKVERLKEAAKHLAAE